MFRNHLLMRQITTRTLTSSLSRRVAFWEATWVLKQQEMVIFLTDLAHEEWIWVFRFVSENEVLAFKYTNPVQITPYDFGPGFWFIALWRLISVYGGSSYLNSNLSFFNGGPGGPVRVDYLEIFQKIMKPGCWIFSEKRRPSSDLQQAPGTPGALHSPGHRLKNGEEISSRMPVVQNTAFLVSTRFNHI